MATDISTLALEVDSRGVVRARDELGRFAAAGERTATVAEKTTSAWRGFSSVLASLGLGLVARELVQVADTMSLLDARLKLSTKSSMEFMAAQADIYRIAQKNNVGIKETTELYVKLSDPIRALGGSTKEVAAIAESFAASLRVGGASAQEASAATRQFAQAMASGVLRGDEFNSIAEASPRFMKAMADGMGVPTGALRKMAEEGKLTADVVGNALVGGLAKLQAESASMPDTVGGAFQRLNNDIAATIGKFNEATGATVSLASGIGVVSDIAGRLSAVMSASLADGVTKAGDSFDFLSASIRVVGTVFETLMVLGLNVSFVLKGVGREIGGIGAQLAALATGDFKAFAAIRKEMVSDSESARAALDRETASIVGMTGKALQARDIVKGFSLSQAEASNEMARLTARTNAASSSYAKLTATISGSGAGKAQKATEDPAYKEAMRAAMLRQELRIKENEQIAAFYREQQELQIKEVAKLRAAAESINDRAQAQENANKTFGKGKAALEELTLAQLEQNKATLMASDTAIPGVIDAIEQQIAAQKRLISATASGERLEAEKKRMDDIAQEWKKTTETINGSLTDALLRGFESGKGFAENLRDTLKNMFKTLVLKPVISAIVSPISQGFGGASGGAGGGVGSLFSSVGSLLPSGIGSAFGTFGSGIGAGFGAALGESGFGGAFSAAGTALGAGNIAGGIGTAIGALGAAMPYIGAAIALYNLVKTKKTPHLGSSVLADSTGATSLRGDYLAGNFNEQTDSALKYLTLGGVGSLNKLDKTFGGQGDYAAIAKFAADGKDASPGDANIYKGGVEVSALLGEGYKLYTKDSEAAFKEFTADFEKMTIETIRGMSKLPVYVKAEFDKLGDSATTEGIATLVDQIGVFQGQLTTMKLAIGSLGSASDDALASIIANTGGIQQFSAAVDAYYANFYTEAEQLAFSTSQLSVEFEKLGVTMPESRKDFRDLVESLDTTTASGRDLYSSLLRLSGSFASVIPAAEEAKIAIGEVITEAIEVAKAAALPTFTPLSSDYGSYVVDGVTYMVGNAADIQAAAAAKSAGALGTVTSALTEAAGAWKSVGDAITDEVRRIRGEMAGFEKQGEAFALAQFATLTAQARAGDINAAKLLPQASQEYLSLAGQNATSLVDFRRAQGATLSSLLDAQSALGLASSTTYTTPSTTYPGITPPPGASGAAFDALVEEVRALKSVVESSMAISNINTRKTADTLVRVTEGGDAMLTRAAP